MTDKEIFFIRMRDLVAGEAMDEIEMLCAPGYAEELDDGEVHTEYVKQAGLPRLHRLLARYPSQGRPWPWHAQAISEGKYPLNNLPEGVRELARKLYYGNTEKED